MSQSVLHLLKRTDQVKAKIKVVASKLVYRITSEHDASQATLPPADFLPLYNEIYEITSNQDSIISSPKQHSSAELLYKTLADLLKEALTQWTADIPTKQDFALIVTLNDLAKLYHSYESQLFKIFRPLDFNVIPTIHLLSIQKLSDLIFLKQVYQEYDTYTKYFDVVVDQLKILRNPQNTPDNDFYSQLNEFCQKVNDLQKLITSIDFQNEEFCLIESLEIQLLNESDDYYQKKAAQFTKQLETYSYLIEVYQFYIYEQSILNKLFNQIPEIIQKHEELMIKYFVEDYSKILFSEDNNQNIQSMFITKQSTQLYYAGCLYQKYGLSDITKMMIQTLNEELKSLNVKFIEESIQFNDNQSVSSSQSIKSIGRQSIKEIEEQKQLNNKFKYLQSIQQLYEKYKSIIIHFFFKNSDMFLKLNNTLQSFLSSKKKNFFDLEETILKFSNSILTRSQQAKSQKQIDAAVETISSLTSFIIDKTSFLEQYQQLLTLRLIKRQYIQLSKEKEVSSKLLKNSGHEILQKIKTMLQEYEPNGCSLFNKNFENFRSFQCSIQLFSESNWPTLLQYNQNALTDEIQELQSAIAEDFSKNVDKKTIKWDNSLSTVVLKYKSNTLIQCSIYQAQILFSLSKSIVNQTAEMLSQNLQIEMSYLKKNLSLLVKANLIIANEEQYQLNENVKDMNITVKMVPAFKDAQEKYSEGDGEDVSYEQVIEAGVVRIMKQKGSCQYAELISELLSANQKYTLSAQMIKERIEKLIDKEYLTRDSEDLSRLNYQS